MIEVHEYQPGAPFGRCAVCNRRKVSHETPTAPLTIPPGVTFDPGPGVTEVLDLQRRLHGIPVTIRRKQGMGKGSDSAEMVWPDGWRLPHVGESLWFGDKSGRVTDVRFDLDRERIIISID